MGKNREITFQDIIFLKNPAIKLSFSIITFNG